MLFRWRHLEEDLAALREVAEDPVRLLEIAQAGQRKLGQPDRHDRRGGRQSLVARRPITGGSESDQQQALATQPPGGVARVA